MMEVVHHLLNYPSNQSSASCTIFGSLVGLVIELEWKHVTFNVKRLAKRNTVIVRIDNN